MRRRPPPEIPENHDRWLVSYADFITLLFAFFVVMYSLSSANEGSYRVLSESIISAFSKPRQTLDPIQVGEMVRSPLSMQETPDSVSMPPVVIPLRADNTGQQPEGSKGDVSSDATMDTLSTALSEQVPTELAVKGVNVKRDRFWIEVEVNSTLLFPSGSGVLLASAVPILTSLADVLAPVPNRIRVEGFTDNVPIRNDLFPSNWELSAARASSVVRLFESSGIDPSRLSAVAFGEQGPVASNDSEDGRAKNRRVVLVILAADARAQDERLQGLSVRQP